MKLHRVDQMLSRYGYCSRSEARAWVRAGRVAIEGQLVVEADTKAAPGALRVDGEPIENVDGILAVLHKPSGYVSSRDAREGPTVYDLLPARWSRRNPPVTSIGRLDKDATGVLLITDDGALVQRWTSPRHKVPKIYEVTVNRELDPALVALFASGKLQLEAEASPCHPARLEILGPRAARLQLTEGRYHQVKRMFASQGCEVVRLHRSQFGEFSLGSLAPGDWRLEPIEHARTCALSQP